MNKIRILHLIKSLNRGGAETLLAEGLRFADRERFDLSYGFFNPRLNAVAPILVANGASVTCFGGDNHISMIVRIYRVAQHLRDQRIDLLHCHLPTAGAVGRIAARMVGVPVVYTEHNKPEWYRKPTFLLNSWTYDLQHQVIAVSASVEQSIRANIRTTVPVTVVRNGVDSAYFHRAQRDGAAVRQQLNIPLDAIVIGNVAALDARKRLHDWIDAVQIIHRRFPDTRFLLVGEGQQRAQLLRRIDREGLQRIVHVCDSQADVRPYMAAMNIYMMSSEFEGLPVAMLEAMAMECAPVCTAVGGIPEVIRDGESGFLTKPGRPDQLAGRVAELIEDPARLRAMVNAARRDVEDSFRIDRMTREIEALYAEVLDRRQLVSPGSGYR